MSAFFSSTTIAANALYGDFKFKPYYNGLFHLKAIGSFICHAIRAIYNLAALMWHAVLTPFCLLNPLFWPSLPGHAMNIMDNVLGFAINLVTIAVSPLIFALRTLTSLIWGYDEETEYDDGAEEEERDLSLAMTIA